jgi:hypothetical protein
MVVMDSALARLGRRIAKVIHSAGIFPPCGRLRASEAISASNVMVDADLRAAQAADVLFRPIRARTVKAARFLMVDLFDFETLMQVVP